MPAPFEALVNAIDASAPEDPFAHPEGSLPAFAAAIEAVMLVLRDEGLLLSSMDQHVLLRWFEDGLPERVVVRTLCRDGERLKRRKRPPRGLPLKALDSSVRKAAQRAATMAIGAHAEDGENQDASSLIDDDGALEPLPESRAGDTAGAWRRIVEALTRTLQDRPTCDPTREALAEALAALLKEPEDPAATLLVVQRTYYDRCWALWPTDEQQRVDAAIDAEHSLTFRRMDPESVATVRAELRRRAVRAADPVLDPTLRLRELLDG